MHCKAVWIHFMSSVNSHVRDQKMPIYVGVSSELVMAFPTGLIKGLLAASLLSPAFLPGPVAAVTEHPIRWVTGAAVWSTPQDAMNTFLKTGEITDRGLEGGLNGSGWSAEDVRAGLNKSYSVDFLRLSRFLYSPAGEAYLAEQTRSYVPYWTQRTWAVQALRSAIILDAADGSISGAGIITQLPVDFRIDNSTPFDGKQNVAAQANCKSESQCTSLFSWLVFLPVDLSSR
jgi:hypothetical protein